jgi:acyl-coenzyme A synthetase/AMP-(fatty) acid ligase
VSPDDVALVLFTSGSTGLPKGVVHTHGSLRAKWSALRRHVPLEMLDCTLCMLPTHFGHGLVCNTLYPLLAGRRLVLLPPADAGALAQLGRVIDEHHVTFVSSVPSLWRVVLRIGTEPASSTLRQVHIGSAPLGRELWLDVRRWTGTDRVWNTYGITETGSWIAGPAPSEPAPTPADGYIGVGWGADIAIGAAGEAQSAAGEPGPVRLRTEAIMREYLNRPDDTAAVLDDGWFATGDLGLLDERGHLHLTGRVRNEINKGGTKVSPEELDLVLERHPGLVEACVFGVDDDLLGQDIAACIVVAPGADRPRAGELVRWTATQVSDVKVPRRWFVVDALPRSPRGKVLRSAVAARCTDAHRLR